MDYLINLPFDAIITPARKGIKGLLRIMAAVNDYGQILIKFYHEHDLTKKHIMFS